MFKSVLKKITSCSLFYLLLLLELLELLQHKVHLFVGGERGDVPIQVLAVVLGVVVALAAGVDPQAGLSHLTPALAALLGWNREPPATDQNIS